LLGSGYRKRAATFARDDPEPGYTSTRKSGDLLREKGRIDDPCK
jgi:hypothetical protein